MAGAHRHIRRNPAKTLGIMRYKFELPEERVAEARHSIEGGNAACESNAERERGEAIRGQSHLGMRAGGGVGFIITGDQHLLHLGKFGGVSL